MNEYLNTVEDVLENGTYKQNRTAVDTISGFSKHYTIDVSDSYPLLTTKKMDGFRWGSMLNELFWYLRGEEHIRELRKHTSVWDEWADEDGHLDTAYGRFWRRYPVPDAGEGLPGETWDQNEWTTVEDRGDGEEQFVFDQIQYVIDQLNENPYSRRLVVNAWHPGNAAISTLPPCHFTFVFNVQGDGTLNLHLTQRSGDLALGIPFNIACYALILKIIAQQTGFEPGTFSHTIVDAHVYCGRDERGEWYGENLDEIKRRVSNIEASDGYSEVKEWIEATAPDGETDQRGKPYDHVPGLLEQLTREPNDSPTIEIADKDIDNLEFDDIEVRDYEHYDGIDFGVAE